MAEEGDDGDMMLMCELVDEKDPESQEMTKVIVTLGEEKVCHHNHTLEDCVDATDTEVVTPGEVVAPQDHDTRRKDVVALETGDGVAPKVHNTMCDDVARLEEGKDVEPED